MIKDLSFFFLVYSQIWLNLLRDGWMIVTYCLHIFESMIATLATNRNSCFFFFLNTARMSHAGRIENASFNAGIVSFQSHITRFYLLTRPKDEARRGWLVQQSERDGQQSAITVMKILNNNKKPALPCTALHCTAIARLPAITNFCRPHYLPARSLRPLT
jgi:hypothetical protein